MAAAKRPAAGRTRRASSAPRVRNWGHIQPGDRFDYQVLVDHHHVVPRFVPEENTLDGGVRITRAGSGRGVNWTAIIVSLLALIALILFAGILARDTDRRAEVPASTMSVAGTVPAVGASIASARDPRIILDTTFVVTRCDTGMVKVPSGANYSWHSDENLLVFMTGNKEPLPPGDYTLGRRRTDDLRFLAADRDSARVHVILTD